MNILDRILPIYKRNHELEKRADVWEWCNSHNISVPMTEANFENMANTDLIFGFFSSFDISSMVNDQNTLNRFAELLGVRGVQNPEGGANPQPIANYMKYSDRELLNEIENKLGFEIHLPEFIGGRLGLKTDHGIISDRHIHYLYILKRIIELCPDRNSSIIEIGGGLGLLPYFLDKAGYKDYTCIDLAHVNVIQAYFLNRNLPERDLILSGENNNPYHFNNKESTKLLHSTDFKINENGYDMNENRFDLMINIDGLTEMGIEEATKYKNSKCAKLFLSINHEVNPYRVIDIPGRKLISRNLFWLRPGYVEELYK
jgi:hypothetical protein